MKTRGTRGGIILSLEAQDSIDDLEMTLADHQDLLAGKVFLELTERISWPVVEAVAKVVAVAGGELADLRPPSAVMQARGETVIIAKTIRSGGRVESSGSAIILGDVNAGAEIIAEDDIIVLGTLRGLAHAGAGGNENAFIWAQQILSPQLRIGGALAQAGEGAQSQGADGPEIAHLANGQIILRPWER